MNLRRKVNIDGILFGTREGNFVLSRLTLAIRNTVATIILIIYIYILRTGASTTTIDTIIYDCRLSIRFVRYYRGGRGGAHSGGGSDSRDRDTGESQAQRSH